MSGSMSGISERTLGIDSPIFPHGLFGLRNRA